MLDINNFHKLKFKLKSLALDVASSAVRLKTEHLADKGFRYTIRENLLNIPNVRVENDPYNYEGYTKFPSVVLYETGSEPEALERLKLERINYALKLLDYKPVKELVDEIPWRSLTEAMEAQETLNG